MDSTNRWRDHLNKKRNIALPVIQQAQLTTKNGWLEIPVLNPDGERVFSKYRRPFDKDDGPKYTYDAGAKTSVYGIERLHGVPHVFITEGELDVLAIRSVGREAVSSTGGSLSFQEDWVPLFDGKKITILYDNDDTGINGAIKVCKLFQTECEVRWVPPLYGKDVGDVLENYGPDKLKELLSSENNALHITFPELSNKTQIKAFRKELNNMMAPLSTGSIGRKILTKIVVDLSMQLSARTKKFVPTAEFNSDKDKAKQYPIENLLEVRRGYARCPFHTEKTASFHVYKNNTGYCFGCQRYADSIDVAMVILNLTFEEAIKHLTK